ncbi:MAG: hypothetical protein ABSA05_14810 [Opitutaceae bacterium]|jgi:hypothetical protein
MTNHPAIVSLPQALWSFAWTAGEPCWKDKYDAWAIQEIHRALARGPNSQIAKDVLGLVPYRPDLLIAVGPSALGHPALRATVAGHPACVLALLLSHYDETAAALEPYLDGSGESVYHLLRWAAESRQPLRQPEGYYRRILVCDSFWGLRYARETSNPSLLAEIIGWCSDERGNYAAAAAYHLLRHPEEAVAPYREVLTSGPFYAYLALPRLSLRGFAVEPEDIGGVPKWACQFALSDFASRRDDFIAAVGSDPAWTVELAAGLGWLLQPAKLMQAGHMVSAGGVGHPLQRPAMRYLLDVKLGRITP